MKSIVVVFLQASSPSWLVLGFFCLLIDGKCWQNVIEIEKSNHTACVCVCGVTVANVMFAYFEIKNQYTVTYRERIFPKICCEKVMDFLISSLLVIELNEKQQLSAGARSSSGLSRRAQGLGNSSLGHALSWCLLRFLCKARSELFILVVQYMSGRGLIIFSCK